MARLILDTSLLIAAERGLLDLRRIVVPDDDVAIAAVTAAELLVGVELADGRRRPRRRRTVESLLAALPLEPYDLQVARVHGRYLAHSRRSGRTRSSHALIVAATAGARDRSVVTMDERGFSDLPGLTVRAVA